MHGIDVAGGTFPAQIWGSYMDTAKGTQCASFPTPSKPAKFSPFYGKHAKQGRSSGGTRTYLRRRGGGNSYNGGGYSDDGYRSSPQFYESPSDGGNDGGGNDLDIDVPEVPEVD